MGFFVCPIVGKGIKFHQNPKSSSQCVCRLKRLVRRIVVTQDGVLSIELVIGSRRNVGGPNDEFVPTTNWWPYRGSSPSFSLGHQAKAQLQALLHRACRNHLDQSLLETK